MQHGPNKKKTRINVHTRSSTVAQTRRKTVVMTAIFALTYQRAIIQAGCGTNVFMQALKTSLFLLSVLFTGKNIGYARLVLQCLGDFKQLWQNSSLPIELP